MLLKKSSNNGEKFTPVFYSQTNFSLLSNSVFLFTPSYYLMNIAEEEYQNWKAAFERSLQRLLLEPNLDNLKNHLGHFDLRIADAREIFKRVGCTSADLFYPFLEMIPLGLGRKRYNTPRQTAHMICRMMEWGVFDNIVVLTDLEKMLAEKNKLKREAASLIMADYFTLTKDFDRFDSLYGRKITEIEFGCMLGLDRRLYEIDTRNYRRIRNAPGHNEFMNAVTDPSIKKPVVFNTPSVYMETFDITPLAAVLKDVLVKAKKNVMETAIRAMHNAIRLRSDLSFLYEHSKEHLSDTKNPTGTAGMLECIQMMAYAYHNDSLPYNPEIEICIPKVFEMSNSYDKKVKETAENTISALRLIKNKMVEQENRERFKE